MTGLPTDTEQLALAVCRLSWYAPGRVRHPHQVGIAVRAALFTELARSGRLVGRIRPEAIGESDTGNPLPDALHRAVARRRPALWKRWYSHVDADRQAATEALVAAGRWQVEGRRLIDVDAVATALQQRQVEELLAAKQAPDTLDEVLLVLLAGGHGAAGARPAPRRSRRLAKKWLEPQLRTAGHGGDATLAAVFYALTAMRRAHAVPLLSR
jgi:hypothetical protein